MFIQNQIDHLNNHEDIIAAEIESADKMLFVVAYVRENGVDRILDKIKGKPTKLLCSLDMGITQLSGIKKLIENGVEVKVYKSSKGTFHPKIWLFGTNNNHWKMLIGSANLTRAAFVDNVEASVLIEGQSSIEHALLFFNYLWNTENSSPVTIEEIDALQDKMNERKAFKSHSAGIEIENSDDSEKMVVLFEYIKNWIDIPKFKSKGISSIWRGWYIIPDQGYIYDDKISQLCSYLPVIGNSIHQTEPRYQQLLTQFVANSNFQRPELVTSPHGLFVRQAKNYLIKLGWCYHPIKANGKLDKKTLCLTDLGIQISSCGNPDDVKTLYTDYFLDYSYNGLFIVRFTRNLLHILDHLTLNEFNYFVTHAYHDDDIDTIVSLIKIHRSLSSTENFHTSFKNYFEQEKGRTAKNVYGNYVKNIKHTISVIGWCNGLSVDDSFTLRLNSDH